MIVSILSDVLHSVFSGETFSIMHDISILSLSLPSTIFDAWNSMSDGSLSELPAVTVGETESSSICSSNTKHGWI